ncbi:hypothetical protein C8R45DRAFT_1080913 [Mycena sanguinolenta]|nr:hypothetical protein C8R45DRAFT_1080913 [Mycena sanguinolenta]
MIRDDPSSDMQDNWIRQDEETERRRGGGSCVARKERTPGNQRQRRDRRMARADWKGHAWTHRIDTVSKTWPETAPQRIEGEVKSEQSLKAVTADISGSGIQHRHTSLLTCRRILVTATQHQEPQSANNIHEEGRQCLTPPARCTPRCNYAVWTLEWGRVAIYVRRAYYASHSSVNYIVRSSASPPPNTTPPASSSRCLPAPPTPINVERPARPAICNTSLPTLAPFAASMPAGSLPARIAPRIASERCELTRRNTGTDRSNKARISAGTVRGMHPGFESGICRAETHLEIALGSERALLRLRPKFGDLGPKGKNVEMLEESRNARSLGVRRHLRGKLKRALLDDEHLHSL